MQGHSILATRRLPRVTLVPALPQLRSLMHWEIEVWAERDQPHTAGGHSLGPSSLGEGQALT